jgi:hypothetical protein
MSFINVEQKRSDVERPGERRQDWNVQRSGIRTGLAQA